MDVIASWKDFLENNPEIMDEIEKIAEERNVSLEEAEEILWMKLKRLQKREMFLLKKLKRFGWRILFERDMARIMSDIKIGVPYARNKIDKTTGRVVVVCPVCGEGFDPCVEHTDPRSYSTHYVEEHKE